MSDPQPSDASKAASDFPASDETPGGDNWASPPPQSGQDSKQDHVPSEVAAMPPHQSPGQQPQQLSQRVQPPPQQLPQQLPQQPPHHHQPQQQQPPQPDESAHKTKISPQDRSKSQWLVKDETFESILGNVEEKMRDNILDAVHQKGWTNPSQIQVKAVPKIIGRENVIGQAHHGSGKTGAFALGMIALVKPQNRWLQGIVISPTRELAIQNFNEFNSFSEKCGVKIEKCVRGERRERINAHIVVGTPGTLRSCIRQRKLDASKVSIFCVDEADELLAVGYAGRRNSSKDQTEDVLKACPDDCQVLLFSATFPKTVRQTAVDWAPKASRITVRNEDLDQDTIKQVNIVCKDKRQKYTTLINMYDMVDSIGQSMIFCQTRLTAKELTNNLRKDGFGVSLLHGKDMPDEERDHVMQLFRNLETNVLIATNVLARGIDVSTVNLVINYEVPRKGNYQPDPVTYIHRVGRSGRFGQKGIAINFIEDQESKDLLDSIFDNYPGLRNHVEEFNAEQIDIIENYVRDYVG